MGIDRSAMWEAADAETQYLVGEYYNFGQLMCVPPARRQPLQGASLSTSVTARSGALTLDDHSLLHANLAHHLGSTTSLNELLQDDLLELSSTSMSSQTASMEPI